jgi:hypothetical protein
MFFSKLLSYDRTMLMFPQLDCTCSVYPAPFSSQHNILYIENTHSLFDVLCMWMMYECHKINLLDIISQFLEGFNLRRIAQP